MIALRSELPLKGDTSSRFVVWLVMVLVFMAAIAVTTNAYIGALSGGRKLREGEVVLN